MSFKEHEHHRLQGIRKYGLVALAAMVLALSLGPSTSLAQGQQVHFNLQNNIVARNESPTPYQPSYMFTDEEIPPFLRENPLHIFGQSPQPFTTAVYAEHAVTTGGQVYNGYLEVVKPGDEMTDVNASGDIRIIASTAPKDFWGYDDLGQIEGCNQLLYVLSEGLPISQFVYDGHNETNIDCGSGIVFDVSGGPYSVSVGDEIVAGRHFNYRVPTEVIDTTAIYGTYPACFLKVTGEKINGHNTADGEFIVYPGEAALFTLENGRIEPVQCSPDDQSSAIYLPVATN